MQQKLNFPAGFQVVHQYHALLRIALWQIASLRESDSVAMLKHELVACVWFYASAGWSLLLIVTESMLTKAHWIHAYIKLKVKRQGNRLKPGHELRTSSHLGSYLSSTTVNFFFKDLQQLFSLLDHTPGDFNLLLVTRLMAALVQSMITADWLDRKPP